MAKKKKADVESGPSDHLKYYCIVFGVLVVVIGVVLVMQRNTLAGYKQANKQARTALKATGQTADGRPRGIGELAVEVEKFVQGYRASSGGGAAGGEAGDGISNVKMSAAETKVNMERTWAGAEGDDPNRGKGFRTKYREFKYANCSLEQFTTLIRNVESWGRYRVYEMRWNLADPKQNSKPPFNIISKPSIKVGFRTPLARDR